MAPPTFGAQGTCPTLVTTLFRLHIFSFQVKDALSGIEEKQVEVLYYKKDGKIS